MNTTATQKRLPKRKATNFPKIDALIWRTAGRKPPRAVLAAALAAGLALGGCAQLPPASPLAYGVGQTQQVQQVQLGTVLAVLRVSIQPNSSGLGGIGGMAAGGFLGHQIGGGRGQTAVTVIGAIAGAIAGNRAEGAAAQTQGVQVTVRLDTGNVIAVTQAADMPLSVGERVQVIGGGWGQSARVLPLQTKGDAK